jgi:hypothetical protein
VTVPLGAVDLARRASELRELLTCKREALSWADYQIDALVRRVEEIETAALALSDRKAVPCASDPQP